MVPSLSLGAIEAGGTLEHVAVGKRGGARGHASGFAPCGEGVRVEGVGNEDAGGVGFALDVDVDCGGAHLALLFRRSACGRSSQADLAGCRSI